MEITYTLNSDQANKLFDNEAVFMYSHDVIPEYRVIELFGDDVAPWLDFCCRHDGYMKSGRDYNYSGDVHEIFRTFYRAGFLKVVSKFNHKLLLQSHRTSEAGKLADQIAEERSQKLAQQDAEEERKRAERRAKRAAAKADKEKQEALV